jgi:hypothetical protein
VAALTAWLYGWLPDSGPYEDADGRGAAELDADALVRLHQLEDAYQADSTEALSAWVAAWRSRVPANTADDVAKLVELTGPASDGHDVVSLSEPESVDTGGSAAPDAIHAEPLTGDEVIPDTELTYRQALGLAYDVVTAATTDGVWPAIEQAPRGEAVRLASDGCTFLLWRDLSQLEARPEWLFDLGVRDFWLGDTDANADSLQSFRDATVIQVTHCRPARIEPTVYLQPVDIRLLHTFVYSEPPLRDPTATPTSVPTMPGYPGYIGPPSQFPTPLTPGSDDALEVNRRLRFLHRVLAGSEDAWPWEAQPAPRMYVLQADAMRAAAVALDRVVLLERTDETWVYSGRSADLSRRY